MDFKSEIKAEKKIMKDEIVIEFNPAALIEDTKLKVCSELFCGFASFSYFCL